ncbi:hypothetical protein CSB09_00135 [Candidatus Gracilibacteria bacterium]|nr:MAG: hypothetical protein CSB09_00135 [Candidatus Gracilibacteria bacterium]
MNPAWEITTEKWNELIKFGMVTSKTTKEGINYYITDKAIEYVEGVDRDYANKVSLYKKDKLLWTDRNTASDSVKRYKNSVHTVL